MCPSMRPMLEGAWFFPDMSGEVLSRMAAGESIKKVHVGVGDDGNFVYQIT